MNLQTTYDESINDFKWLTVPYKKYKVISYKDVLKTAIINLAFNGDINILPVPKATYHSTERKADIDKGIIVVYYKSICEVWKRFGKGAVRNVDKAQSEVRNTESLSDKELKTIYKDILNEFECSYDQSYGEIDLFGEHDVDFFTPETWGTDPRYFPFIYEDYIDNFIELVTCFTAILRRMIQYCCREYRIGKREIEYATDLFEKAVDDYYNKNYIVMQNYVYTDIKFKNKAKLDLLDDKDYVILDDDTHRPRKFHYKIILTNDWKHDFPKAIYEDYKASETKQIAGIEVNISKSSGKFIEHGNADYFSAIFTKSIDDAIKLMDYILKTYLDKKEY